MYIRDRRGWGYSNIKLLGQERIPFTPSCQLQNILTSKKKRDNDIKEIKKKTTNFAKFVISVVWTGNDCIPTIHLGYIYRCIGRGCLFVVLIILKYETRALHVRLEFRGTGPHTLTLLDPRVPT